LANMEMLEDVGLGKDCGANDTTEPTFVCGIFLSISAGKNTVPLLQAVYQVYAARMNFGKYTLYSCYGITAKCNSFSVAFGTYLAMRTRTDGKGFGSLHQQDNRA
jgi:hypothetical protein